MTSPRSSRIERRSDGPRCALTAGTVRVRGEYPHYRVARNAIRSYTSSSDSLSLKDGISL